MTDERQKATKVKCERDESLTKQSIFVDIVFSRTSIWVLLELVRRWTQHFTKIHYEKPKIEQICICNPMTTGFIMKTLIYVISMEFLSWSRRRSSARNVPSSEERGETDVFPGYSFPGPPLSKMAAESNFPPWDVQDVKFSTHMRFTGCNSRGL